MNELGATVLILSGALMLLGGFMLLLGISLRQELLLSRSFSLELFGRLNKKRSSTRYTHYTHYTRYSRRYSRLLLSFWRPLKRYLLHISGLQFQARALDICRYLFYSNFILTTVALAILLSLMLESDLSNRYVVSHSSATLPAFFRMTAVWAGSSGSLLFWYWLLTLFSAIAVGQGRRRLHNRFPPFMLILFAAQLFFILLLLFFRDAQPFRTYALTMESGRGINPLLLHWAMIIHPPILYIGYVSSVIPFALIMSALISGNLREDFLPFVRRWAIFSWFFLGTGILLGSKWAYEELGWGGYWAWDPVENASLMPWLIATAFLHSLIVQERRGLLRFWNVILVTLFYHACLVGTWITRSGVLEGPHVFAESDIGPFMIAYIAASLLFYSRFIYFGRHKLHPQGTMEVVTSKEGSILWNNFLMILIVAIILTGVFSPFLPLDCSFEGGSFGCHRVEWKPAAYNRLIIPLALFTLFLMGASPLLAWRKSAWKVWKKSLRWPLLFGLAAGTAFAVSYGYLFSFLPSADTGIWGEGYISEALAVLTVGVSGFVAAGLFQEYFLGIRSRMLRFGEQIPTAFIRLVLRNKRRYGGYLVHLSIVFLFIGYAGSAFKKTQRFEFHYKLMRRPANGEVIHYRSGDKAYLDNYQVQAGDFFLRPLFQPGADRSNRLHFTISQEAHFRLWQGETSPAVVLPPGQVDPYLFANQQAAFPAWLLESLSGRSLSGKMKTERHFHTQADPVSGNVLRSQDLQAVYIPTSEPDIYSTWKEDFYIQLGTFYQPQQQQKQQQNPLLNRNYEAYYHQFNKDPQAYYSLFPTSLILSLQVWINPLVKFIWLGSLLFFFSSLILLLPFGERQRGSKSPRRAAGR